jgi:hypothetical protein
VTGGPIPYTLPRGPEQRRTGERGGKETRILHRIYLYRNVGYTGTMEDRRNNDDDLTFDFEQQLESTPAAASRSHAAPAASAKPRNYKQTVCTYWLRNLCMKGDTCGFLHEFDPEKMPVCKNLLKFGQCKEPDCPFKHTTESIKECNMYKLGFCIYGPACRFKHTRQAGPPPDPSRLEAAKPKDYRNINIVANQANEGILPDQNEIMRLTETQNGNGGGQALALPGIVDPSLLASVGQRDLRYGF